jgi:hypothetical protein
MRDAMRDGGAVGQWLPHIDRQAWTSPDRYPVLAVNRRLGRENREVLDGLRRQRNINDYDGNPISPTVVEECQKQAQALLAHVRTWLQMNHPALR